MKPLLPLLILILPFAESCAQSNAKRNTPTGRETGCEGCEAIYESPVPLNQLSWTDTLPDFGEPGPKMLISGTIYKPDGKTPAKDVVLYIYHTNRQGIYPTKGNETGWGKRHGYLRGWIKTNEKGQYAFYTLKPGSYPSGNTPAHIHPIIKEPGLKEYWIDEYLFDNDPLLTSRERQQVKNRGGNGIIILEQKGNLLVGKRDIILGLNVSGYPGGFTNEH